MYKRIALNAHTLLRPKDCTRIKCTGLFGSCFSVACAVDWCAHPCLSAGCGAVSLSLPAHESIELTHLPVLKSAGLFWGVEGAIILGYPEEGKRGKYLAYWLSWRSEPFTSTRGRPA